MKHICEKKQIEKINKSIVVNETAFWRELTSDRGPHTPHECSESFGEPTKDLQDRWRRLILMMTDIS